MRTILKWIWFLIPWSLTAQSAGTPVSMVITVGHSFADPVPRLQAKDFTVSQGRTEIPVANLTFRESRTDLMLLVDECSSCEAGTKFQELRAFIASQPAATRIGVAYIQDGTLVISQPLTTDRDSAITALTAPTGSKPANPFQPLTELMRHWPADSARHVVLMISNGVDPSSSGGLINPAAESAIEAAQRGGVIVYAIYHPAAHYETEDFSEIYRGQVQLAHVADETGGEAYFLGFGPLPPLAPFLEDIEMHLANEYVVQFIAHAPKEATGELEEVNVTSRNRAFDLRAPYRIWVSPAMP